MMKSYVIGNDDADTAKVRFVSSIIPASSAGTVPLGGAADVDASKLETGDPNKARTALGGSIHDRCSAYWGCAGADCWYCGQQVHKVQAKKYIRYMFSRLVKMTGMFL